ncbi:glycoside hydrolase family 2 protein [Haloferula chungangensis]|uniref:Glycoside hydrolase family 2 protein n=1 Tax=Haloferula chungangensis TaxID=1048331 RepID=A0ABW2L7V7_9BACT
MKAIFSALILSISVLHADDFADAPDFAHAMQIETRELGGFPVVFHYGEIRPDFEDHSANPHRRRSSLDGPWHFRFDPENIGLTEKWHSSSDLDAWTSVNVPHCWDMMAGGRFWDWSDRSMKNPPMYDGAAWYRRDFDTELLPGKSHRLEFLGVPHRVRIFLNGELLARHEGGGQPFSLNLSNKVRSGSNTLAVQIIRLPNFREKKDGKGFDEIEYTHTRHPKAPDNWPYAGIPRSVSLISENLVTIRKTQIRTLDGKLEAILCLSNHDTKAHNGLASISSSAIESTAALPYEIAPGGHQLLRFSAPLKKDASLWSPDSPQLYQLVASLSEDDAAIDQLQTTFGIRSFRVDGTRFSLNNEPIFLKGAAFYEEHPTRGNALTESDHRDFFKLAKDAKANFVRLHVAERHPLTYQLADQQGVLLCGEWGGFWYKEKSMDAQTKDSQSIFQSLGRCALWDLMNHPSVVIWGIHNECHQFCPEYERFVKMGHELVDQHDWQERPVTWAAWHPHMGQPHFEHADAVGFNEYRGAMDPFEKLEPDLKRTIKENPDKPLIILENGGWSKLGDRGPKERKGNENWQAHLLTRQHEVLSRFSPPLSGYTYWLLVDYRSRKTYTGNRKSDGWSRMGMYNEYGQPKLVRDVFRDLSWPVR